MRREQILKICLNHVLNDEVEYKVKDDKSWHFIVNDFSEGEVELMQFCLRFKTPEVAKEFRQAVRDALAGKSITKTSNGFGKIVFPFQVCNFVCESAIFFPDDNVSEEEKKKISELKLPSGFYNHGAKCEGCRGCNADEFVFVQHLGINSDINDDNPLPLKQPQKQFTKPATVKPTLTTFGQLSKNNETSRNIFGSMNNSSTSDQGLFTQSSFTTASKEPSSIFGNNNLFGGNKSIFSKPNEEPKATTPADEVKKNFSFTNSLKPSVFGQNIFGQAATTPALTATFGSTPGKTNEDAGTVKPFSFGEAMRGNATTSFNATTPLANSFSFGKFFVGGLM